MSPKIPTLDFSREDMKPGTKYWESTSKKIRQSLEEYGCFIIDLQDKTPLDLLGQVFGSLVDLFDLPTQTKMKNKYDKPLNGYVGQIPALPLHESLGVDNATSLEATKSFTSLMWPQGNEHFSECLHKYAEFAAKLDQMVTRMIFESYDVEKYNNQYIESTTYLLRVLKNSAPNKENPTLAFVTHTDKSFTTILHQNQVNGLEMETREGERININLSSPSLFMIVAGDALMAWSNDRVWSPRHQVLVSGETDRYSLGMFAFNNGTLQVPEELIDHQHPLMYKPFDHLGLLRFFRTATGYKSKCPIKAYCDPLKRDIIFNKVSGSAEEIASSAIVLAKEWEEANTNLKEHNFEKQRNSSNRSLVEDRQFFPDEEEIFVDAAWRNDLLQAGIACILRKEGRRSRAMVKREDFVGSALMAEALAVEFGLLQARNLGLRRVRIKSDCLSLIKAINNGEDISEIYEFQQDLPRLLSSFISVAFNFIPRTVNVEADLLAKAALRAVVGETN